MPRRPCSASFSLLELDFTDGRERQLHKHFVSVLQAYQDRQRALELFGALKADTQTHIENEIGSKLLPTVGGKAATLAEIRTLAQAHEVRERNRANDMTRLLVRLGIPVKKPKAKAAAKPMAGRQRDDDDSDEGWPDSDKERPDDEDEDEAKAKDEKEEKTPKSSGNLDIDALFNAIAAVTDSDEAAAMKQHYERARARNAANGV